MTTQDGETGTVIGVNQLAKTVKLKIENKEKDSVTVADYAADQIKWKPKNASPAKEQTEADDESDVLPAE